jgi:hypothetical protein
VRGMQAGERTDSGLTSAIELRVALHRALEARAAGTVPVVRERADEQRLARTAGAERTTTKAQLSRPQRSPQAEQTTAAYLK